MVNECKKKQPNYKYVILLHLWIAVPAMIGMKEGLSFTSHSNATVYGYFRSIQLVPIHFGTYACMCVYSFLCAM